MGHIKVKDLLDIYKCGCGPFCVSLLIDFVYIIQQRAFFLRLQISMFWAWSLIFYCQKTIVKRFWKQQ